MYLVAYFRGDPVVDVQRSVGDVPRAVKLDEAFALSYYYSVLEFL